MPAPNAVGGDVCRHYNVMLFWVLEISKLSDSPFRQIILRSFPESQPLDRSAIATLVDRVEHRINELAAQDASIDPEETIQRFHNELTSFVQNPDAYRQLAPPAAPPMPTETQPQEPPPPAPAPAATLATAQASAAAAPRMSSWVRRAAIAVPLLALLLLYSSSQCGWPFSGCSDSGWVAASSKTSNALRIPHRLGGIPAKVHVQFRHTRDSKEIFPVLRSWSIAESGNPVTIAADASDVIINIVGGQTIHGTWSADGVWKRSTDGFYRVIAER